MPLGIPCCICGIYPDRLLRVKCVAGAKMAAHWGQESQEHQVSNIVTVRFLVLVGTMLSLLFAMIGGLICAGRLWL